MSRKYLEYKLENLQLQVTFGVIFCRTTSYLDDVHRLVFLKEHKVWIVYIPSIPFIGERSQVLESYRGSTCLVKFCTCVSKLSVVDTSIHFQKGRVLAALVDG